MKATLPTEAVPIKMAPELAEAVGELLAELEGSDREAADGAVMRVYRSGFAGSFSEIVEKYRAEISAAVGFEVGEPAEEVAEV
jgi:hypothetical protein